MTLAVVKLVLLQQEAQEIKQGVVSVLDDTVSHSVLISMGLELEEQQYVSQNLYIIQSKFYPRRRLRSDMSTLSQHATDLQRAKMVERKNALQRKLDSWCAVQKLYVPGLVMLCRNSDGISEDPSGVPLWLPSAISGKIPCDIRLYSFEWDLRYAQANDALHELRRNLQLRSYLYQRKDRFATGQQANTKSRTTIMCVQSYINASAAQYRIAQKALVSLATILSKDDSWKVVVLDLQDQDIRGMTVGEDGESEGRRSVSWIWKQGGTMSSEDNNMHECKYLNLFAIALIRYTALRIEWCKARARAMRWLEEVRLLVEEMRRVLQFLQWKGRFWELRAAFLQHDVNTAEETTADLVGDHRLLAHRIEGAKAYGLQQASIQKGLHNHF